MSTTMVTVGSKRVLASPSYRPAVAHDDELVGRDHECRMVLAAWLPQPGAPPMAPLLLGEPGVGKNRLVYELARMTRKALYVLQGHEDITAEDLACAVRFSDDPERKMDYVLSPLATAMLHGGIAFIDEIGKLRPRALAPLASVLDDRRYLDSTLLGERITAHPGFRFVAATNAVDLGREGLPDFVRSRVRPVIEVGYPEREEVDRIVRRRVARLAGDGEGLLSHFWGLWDRHRAGTLPSPRDTLYVFGLTMSLADLEAGAADPAGPGSEAGVACPQPRHLEEAFRQIFEAGARAA